MMDIPSRTLASAGRDYDSVRKRNKRDEEADIGSPPPIKNPEQREACRMDLKLFLQTYFPETFHLGFSPDHDTLVAQTQNVILNGGQFITAMPRGSGKTSIFQFSLIWAGMYGHTKYAHLVCANGPAAKGLLRGITTTIESSDILFDDFPEICHPARAIERKANRQATQKCEGELTYIGWSSEGLVFPTTRYSLERGNAGVVLSTGGITGGSARGRNFTGKGGGKVRPDVVLVDDPQTRESASSPAQIHKLKQIITQDIMKMAGPNTKMSIMIAATVICQDDLVEKLADDDHWESLRVRMIKTWPTNMKLWSQYFDLAREERADEAPPGTARAFYIENQAAMDEGGLCYWEDRKMDFHTALEYAMSEYDKDPDAFFSEYQNEPTMTSIGDRMPMVSSEVVKRSVDVERFTIPASHDAVVAFVDVQEKVLFYSVMSFSNKFGSHVVDFGTFPDQKKGYYTNANIQRPLSRTFPDEDTEGCIRRGLITLCRELSNARYTRQGDGAKLGINVGLIDSGYRPDVVEQAIISGLDGQWYAAKGRGIGAKDAEMKKPHGIPGKVGEFGVFYKPQKRLVRTLFIDANKWKTNVHTAVTCDIEHSHGLTIFKSLKSRLEILGDHLAAERPIKVTAKGNTKYEWETTSRENHFFDCITGCYAAASLHGIKKETDIEIKKQRKRRSRSLYG